MKNAFRKNIFRSVKISWTRYVSIVCIVLLGAAVLSGLSAVSPDMASQGNVIFREANMMDIRLISTYGFAEEDIQAIRDVENVRGCMPAYTIDALGSINSKDFTLRIESFSDQHDKKSVNYLNQLKLVEGRLPNSNGNEVLIVRPTGGTNGFSVGDKLTLKSSYPQKLPDMLDISEYIISGLVETPYYISIMQGSTSIGSGTADYIVYLPGKHFLLDVHTTAFVTMDYDENLDVFSDEYVKVIDYSVGNFEKLANARKHFRYDEVTQELTDAKAEYTEKDQEVSEKLADAKKEFADANHKISDAKKELAEKQKEYDDGLEKLNTSKIDLDKQRNSAQTEIDKKEKEAQKAIADAQVQLAQAKTKLEEGKTKLDITKSELNNAKKTYNTKKATYIETQKKLEAASKEITKKEAELKLNEESLELKNSELQTAQSQLNAAIESLETRIASLIKTNLDNPALGAAQQQLNETKTELAFVQQQQNELAAMKEELDTAKITLQNSKKAYEENKKQFDLAKLQIDAQLKQAETEIEAASNEIKKKQEEWDTANAQYQQSLLALNASKKQAEQEISGARKKLRQKVASAESEIIAAQIELDDGKEKLANAEIELKEHKLELADGEKEYNDRQKEADTELADAKQTIVDAEKKIADLGEPEWFILNRNYNEGFTAYKQDTLKMKRLATIFPAIFFAVATLVSLTTMTRMVDEDRILIGTFKSLGYSDARIASKYLGYALSASIIGSIAGSLIGFQVFPNIIWNTYRIILVLPNLEAKIYMGTLIKSMLISSLCVAFATYMAVRTSVKEVTASLLLPKIPPKGKRIFLEYIKPVWRRLTFSQKVTMRNLFSNKKRMIMTVVGIAGCTALLLTGFGIRGAVTGLIDEQFSNIFLYNAMVEYTENDPSDKLESFMTNSAFFSNSILSVRKSVEATPINNIEDANKQNAYLVVPQDAKQLQEMIQLIDALTGEKITFDENSVIITEKLAKLYGLQAGDSFNVNSILSKNKNLITITGISKNYTFHYLYMGTQAYESAFGNKADYNQYFAKIANGKTAGDIKEKLNAISDVGAVVFTEDLISKIANTIDNVNMIVLLLIISAGLLAFVVLYNLTNINIGERQREIATLKVLGFYDKEINAFVFRETLALSIMGCILGLIVGIFLFWKVEATVEMDFLMFSRKIPLYSYAISGAFTLLFAMSVNFALIPKIKHIDMLESLKSVE